jgi:hypothetical protein
MKLILEKIQYDKYAWNICGDLKVIALVLGLQLGCTKFFVSSASGTVETEKITIPERTGQT